MDRHSGRVANNGSYSNFSFYGGAEKRENRVPDKLDIQVLNGSKCRIDVDPKLILEFVKYKIVSSVHPSDINALLSSEFDILFDGKKYPNDMELCDVFKEINYSSSMDIRLRKSDLKDLQEKLEKMTRLKWQLVLSPDSREYELVVECYGRRDSRHIDQFVDQLFSKFPIIKEFSNIAYGEHITSSEEDLSQEYRYVKLFTPIRITISSSQATSILSAATLGYPASLISQAIRTVETAELRGLPLGGINDCPLGRLPKELRGQIASYIASNFPAETAGEMMEEKIFRASNAHWNGFLPAPFIELKEVRQSIGATASVLLENSDSAREKAMRGFEIAKVEMSDAGVVLKFPDESYAQKFFHALEKSGYKTTSCYRIDPPENTQDGTYCTSVTIRELSEVKDFVEVTCGFPETFTLDLFKVSEKKIELKKEFFLKQLESIGKSERISVQERKKKAKLLVSNYLPYLLTQEAAELKLNIKKLSAENYEGKPGPILYLRQHTGLGSILPGESYSDNVATYKTILEKIDRKIPKKN